MDDARFLKELAGATEVDLAIEMEGRQFRICGRTAGLFGSQVNVGKAGADGDLAGIAAEIKGRKDFGGFARLAGRRGPLLVEERPDGVDATAGTCGKGLSRIDRDQDAARRAAVQTGIRSVLFCFIQIPLALPGVCRKETLDYQINSAVSLSGAT